MDVDVESDVVEVEVVTETSDSKRKKSNEVGHNGSGTVGDSGTVGSLLPDADGSNKTKKKHSGSASSSPVVKAKTKSVVSDVSQTSSQYNVEYIVDRRVNHHGVVEYLIKWDGYPTSDNTWEPIKNIYCIELVDAFEANRKKEKKKRQQEHYFPKRVEKKPEIKTNTKKIRQLYRATSSESDSENEIKKNKKKMKKPADSTTSKKLTTPDVKPKITKHSPVGHRLSTGSGAQQSDGGARTAHEIKKPGPPPPKRTDVNVNAFLKARNYAINPASAQTGFDRHYELEEILGLSKTTAGRQFLVKWKGRDELELVPSAVCNKKCPQRVIKFYEKRTRFASDSEEDSFDEFCEAEREN